MKTTQLQKIALFRGIEQDDLHAALHFLNAHQASYQKSEHLVNIGDQWTEAGLVLSGEVEASCVIENFHKITLNHYLPGQVFDPAFATAGAKSPMLVSALSGCEILWLNLQPLNDVASLNEHYQQQLATNLIHLLAQQGIQTTMKLHVASQGTIHDKLLAYLHTLPAIDQAGNRRLPFNQTELAEHLGVNRSALSRAIHQMKTAGILKIDGRQVRVLKH